MKSHNDDTVTVTAAGRKGGLSCLHKKGPEFYSQIGRKGQAAMRQKYPNMARQWGKLGGRPRKNSLDDMGERTNSTKREERTRPNINVHSPTSIIAPTEY